MKTLLVVGFSPAWERGMRFKEFLPGEVNRAVEIYDYASGKPTNLCRALLHWPVKCQTRLLVPLGGLTGERFRRACSEEGISLVENGVSVAAETRICTNIFSAEAEGMTELVEEAGTISAEEAERLLDALSRALPEVDGVVFMGSMPQDAPADLPKRVAQLTAQAGLPLFVDNWKNLREMADCGGKVVLKINRGEVRKLTGRDDLQKGIRTLSEEYPSMILGITDGAEAAWLKVPGEEVVKLPVEKNLLALNPLGAGDTCSGVFFAELLAGTAPADAFRKGLQAASASCNTPIAGLLPEE